MKLCIVFFEQDSLSRAQSFSSFLMTCALMEHLTWTKVLIWGLMKKKSVYVFSLDKDRSGHQYKVQNIYSVQFLFPDHSFFLFVQNNHKTL